MHRGNAIEECLVGGNAPAGAAVPPLDRTRVRFLTPEGCRIHRDPLGALHAEIRGEQDYGGVYAAYAFPVASPEAYICLIQKGAEQDREIGIIRDLLAFDEPQARLVREALRRRYFVHVITRFREIRVEFNLLALRVETDKGLIRFYMRWAQDRTTEYGRRGRVLIDLNDNRYLVPDIEALPQAERILFQRYIYW